MDSLFAAEESLSDRTPQGIALAIGRLISTGDLAEGDKLPTVRAMAEQIGVSPTTVNDAWRILHSHGAITTKGRQGTYVRGPRGGAAPGRYWQVPVDPGTFSIDLSTGTPDPDLLPDLGPILGRVHLDAPVTSYLDAPVLPDLEALLREVWPFPPELLTIVDGAQDGIDRLVSALVNFGDAVLVNDPAFPPLLDMLDQAGARVIGLAMDEEGITPDALEAGLSAEPVALFIQPRAHNPTGATMTPKRAQRLASMIAGHQTVIVEDDHSGDVSGSPLATIGRHLPAQVVHIRSFSKSHGPDLRLAAVGGAAGPIDRLVRKRRLGPSWTSRLLQAVLLEMLEDGDTTQLVERAGVEYARRRERFVAEMAARGVAVGGSSGINVWVPVHDEQFALVSLAANGIGAAPGTPFMINPSPQQHIRVSIGTVTTEMDRVAELVARAAATAR